MTQDEMARCTVEGLHLIAEGGWYYNALSYSRSSKSEPRGVMVFNYDLTLGGTITYAEIAERFHPRVQASLF